MTPHQSRFSALVLCLTMLLPLSSCTKRNQATEPDALMINSENVPTLNQMLDGKQASFVSSDTPTASVGGGSRGEDKNASTKGNPSIYSFVYEDLPEGGKTVKEYMLGLTDLSIGFLVINSQGDMDDPPDFKAENGTLYLTRKNVHDFTELNMRLDWYKNQLMIQAWQQDINDSFHPPEPKADWPPFAESKTKEVKQPQTLSDADAKSKAKASFNPSPNDKKVILSAQEAVSFLKNLSPAMVGLPGSSMKNYNVYYTEGIAKVDDIVCMRLRVYELGTGSGANVFLGTYLLATDASRLYRLESESSPPVEIPLM